MSTTRPREAALTEALLAIVAERGLEHASVREVAAAAGVSIGTVQHYFPTKDAMLSAAFGAAVDRVRARIAAVELGPDVRPNLSAVLAELLPLDDRRAGEVRVHLAFAARAAVSSELAEIQRAVLEELHTALARAFARAAGESGAPTASSRLAAHAAIAAADGLALHAVSAGGWLPPRRQRAALEAVVDVLVGQFS